MKVWTSVFIILLLSFSSSGYAKTSLQQQAKVIYEETKLKKHLDFNIFMTAYKEHVRVADKPIMSIIDYSKPSNNRRFFYY